MFTKLKSIIKNERGLTLIELLAVVVILGIIAAIAIPAIGGIIDNTRKDAHVANAQQMISAAKVAIAGESELLPATGTIDNIELNYLQTGGYIETLEDPDSDGGYDSGYVSITRDGSQLNYSVYLEGSERSVSTNSGAAVAEGSLSRSSVRE